MIDTVTARAGRAARSRGVARFSRDAIRPGKENPDREEAVGSLLISWLQRVFDGNLEGWQIITTVFQIVAKSIRS